MPKLFMMNGCKHWKSWRWRRMNDIAMRTTKASPKLPGELMVVTGYSPQEAMEGLKGTKVFTVLMKPIEPDVLLRTVKKALEARRQQSVGNL
jgi:AmiR/NasT family two-component response regulator